MTEPSDNVPPPIPPPPPQPVPPQTQPPPPPIEYGPMVVTDDEARQWAMFAHVSALCGLFTIPPVIGPLVIWLIKKNQHPFIDDQAKEAINFNITVLIALAVSAVLVLVIIGVFLLIAVGLAWLILTIVASIKAASGVPYRYPLTIRFVT